MNAEIQNKIKNLKLNILQFKYKYLSDIILRLEKHIDTLFINSYLDFNTKNQILGNIFIISKNLNSAYNNYIIEKLDSSNKINNHIAELLNMFKDEDDNELFNKIYPIIKKSIDLPLIEQENHLKVIISNIGFDNIVELIDIYDGNFKLSDKQFELISEIRNIFVPTSINYFSVSHNDEFYWRFPNKYSELDILELTRELWIKNINTENKYLKIQGYFINDSLSCFIKSSQLNYPYLQHNKTKIMTILANSSIDPKFIKKFIRYDYLGNIYCLDTSKYIKYIEESYQTYMELASSSFINIMKDFISKGTDIKRMFESIFLLLLGNVDNIDIAGLLLGITKEKKTHSPLIYTILSQRLPYYLLVKIKKSNNSIKSELDKLKSISLEDIDYKKQLIANKNIPSTVRSITLEKIEEMKSYNNEYYKQLTFVKNILNYPWPSSSEDSFFQNISSSPDKINNYLLEIEDKLKKLSYGHEEAKKNLLQTIGKWISNPSSQGTSFGLVGPPGVGKTLLAKSISKALNIPFAEITLGGQNDGEILHGHGYTYSGSQPGLIIKKMVEMGKSRCILYFDELDKTCSKHGSINEITSILIHLTDPNMNKTFQDRFFQGVDFPLDKVIMIFSYNDSSLVDPILLDRLKQIEVGAYTQNDKIKIVKEFIIPELAQSVGLQNEPWINISDNLIEWIIENYTNEAGVRSIKRKIEQIFLTLNLERFRNKDKIINIDQDTIIRILDKPKNDICKIHDKPTIGIINGLYATTSGDGGIIPIQIFNNFSPNTNSYEIKLTGKQGDVMKESVYCSLTAAIDYIRRNIKKYPFIKNIDEHSKPNGLESTLIENKKEFSIDEHLINNFKYGFHVHAPSTSTPKDGPSAGCAFTSAFISRILGKPIKNDIAMTGEVELTGKITKIGGLNFKLMGAKKAGVNLVFVPLENQKDIEEIKIKYPNLISGNFKVEFFEYIDEIIDKILII
jgi:endopeptidase La